MKKNICIVGIGYIGLPTAAMFSSYGHKVIGVDINENVVNVLNKGKITITEPGLEEFVKKVVSSGNLSASIVPKESDVFIICVPTPINKDKTANIELVISATKSIVPVLKKGNIVVLESTSPVGTTEEVIKPILENSGLNIGKDVLLGYSPERVIPGNIIYELKHNDRVVGGINEKSANEIKELYKTIVDGNIYTTNCKTAELCKLMENTYRDVNIALANELAMICEDLGINVWDVIKYCNKHPRVNIHNPGPGVGGHCLAVDPWFIVEKEPKLAKIIGLSRETNDFMPNFIFSKIEKLLKDIKYDKKITILGATYKANIDDMRESPIIKLVNILEDNGYKVEIYYTFIKDNNLVNEDLLDSCKDSDLIILGVDHDEFKDLPWDEIKKVVRGNIVLDTRNFFNENKIKSSGFIYKLLGKM
ncbi:nucleotide sugar dehydrogenase [Romboutsia sp. Marseille-P6047]|uniref:nucleotide sugar dehydrogenase n=1 Tax=Romboutsia sp. Marseille-P6047 TaxID=2161817 RepID=UPI001FAA928A|nr:nucleotide sugar dehydrogenase [Romboutsia sp. Marseille-P6047]